MRGPFTKRQVTIASVFAVIMAALFIHASCDSLHAAESPPSESLTLLYSGEATMTTLPDLGKTTATTLPYLTDATTEATMLAWADTQTGLITDVAPTRRGCSFDEVLGALRDANRNFVRSDDDNLVVLTMITSRAQQLRNAADEIEAQEKAAVRIRSVLEECEGK